MRLAQLFNIDNKPIGIYKIPEDCDDAQFLFDEAFRHAEMAKEQSTEAYGADYLRGYADNWLSERGVERVSIEEATTFSI